MLAHFVVVGWELQIKKKKKISHSGNENIPRVTDLCKRLCLEKTHDAVKDIVILQTVHIYGGTKLLFSFYANHP